MGKWFVAFTMSVVLMSCSKNDKPLSNSELSKIQSWFSWHDDKMKTDTAVMEAIDPPRRNYRQAVQIIRASDRPDDVKKYDISHLITGSYSYSDAIRPPETLLRGIEMMEEVALGTSGETVAYAPQQLRMIFERGIGLPPNRMDPDPVVAACWRKIEETRTGDPRSCIALRKLRDIVQ